MARPKQEPRVVQLAEIEHNFELASALGAPAVARNRDGGYSIRIRTGLTINSNGYRQESFGYFYTDADGTITGAPRGHAKDYRPGRIPVDQLDAAVQKYANIQKGPIL